MWAPQEIFYWIHLHVSWVRRMMEYKRQKFGPLVDVAALRSAKLLMHWRCPTVIHTKIPFAMLHDMKMVSPASKLLDTNSNT